MIDLPAGRELDALIAEKVMGWAPVHDGLNFRWADGGDYEKRHRYVCDWSPSTDIAAAWQVVERMDSLGWYLTIDRLSSGERVRFWRCEWMRYTEENEKCGDCWEDADTAPLAICRAALEAVAP